MLMVAPVKRKPGCSFRLTMNVKFEFRDDHLKRSCYAADPKILGEEGYGVL